MAMISLICPGCRKQEWVGYGATHCIKCAHKKEMRKIIKIVK